VALRSRSGCAPSSLACVVRFPAARTPPTTLLVRAGGGCRDPHGRRHRRRCGRRRIGDGVERARSEPTGGSGESGIRPPRPERHQTASRASDPGRLRCHRWCRGGMSNDADRGDHTGTRSRVHGHDERPARRTCLPCVRRTSRAAPAVGSDSEGAYGIKDVLDRRRNVSRSDPAPGWADRPAMSDGVLLQPVDAPTRRLGVGRDLAVVPGETRRRAGERPTAAYVGTPGATPIRSNGTTLHEIHHLRRSR
jgi:hypothetical protein